VLSPGCHGGRRLRRCSWQTHFPLGLRMGAESG
jgi:hypothetical protein